MSLQSVFLRLIIVRFTSRKSKLELKHIRAFDVLVYAFFYVRDDKVLDKRKNREKESICCYGLFWQFFSRF